MIIRSIDKKLICLEPVYDVVSKINKSNKNVLLVGGVSTGKSAVLDEYLYQSKWSGENIIDVTVKADEFLKTQDPEMFNLYHMCLVASKLISFIKNKLGDQTPNDLYTLQDKLTEIIQNICYASHLGLYDAKYGIADKKYYEEPGILLEIIIERLASQIDYKTITLILDNFDSYDNSNAFYQKLMYKTLSNYVKIIATVSDESVITNLDRQKELQKNNDLVMVDYSYNLEYVKMVINTIFKRNVILLEDIKRPKIEDVLPDEIIKELIVKTNGNLFKMTRALKQLFDRMYEIPKDNYGKYLLEYLDVYDKALSENPIVSGIVMPVRKLHI